MSGFNPFQMFKQQPNANANPNPNPAPGTGSGTGAANPNPNAGTGQGGFPANPNPNAGTGTAGDGTGSGGPSNDGKDKGTGSPLDAFNDLFTIDPNKKPVANPLSEKLLNLDPAKLSEAVSKMNFAQHVSAELMQKALGGDVQSFSQILNQVSQSSFAAVTNMFTNMMEAAFTKNNDRFNSTLGDRFKEHALSFQKPENAALNHPAAQPVLSAMKQMVAAQFPNLSPTEIAQKAEGFFLAMAESVNAGKTPVEDPSKKGNGAGTVDDWTMFLGMDK